MCKSYGFIEITGVVAAIDALDIMCKTADVELASWERKLGGRLVTIIVEGDVSAVTEAVNADAIAFSALGNDGNKNLMRTNKSFIWRALHFYFIYLISL